MFRSGEVWSLGTVLDVLDSFETLYKCRLGEGMLEKNEAEKISGRVDIRSSSAGVGDDIEERSIVALSCGGSRGEISPHRTRISARAGLRKYALEPVSARTTSRYTSLDRGSWRVFML